jgi:hypothetical protein
MWHRRFRRVLPALGVVAILLVASPVFAAPSPPAVSPAGLVQVLAHWWGELTQPLVSLVAANRQGVDPNGAATLTDSPIVEPQNGARVDPDG